MRTLARNEGYLLEIEVICSCVINYRYSVLADVSDETNLLFYPFCNKMQLNYRFKNNNVRVTENFSTALTNRHTFA